MSVQTKLLLLHEQLKDHLRKLKLYSANDPNAIVSSLNPTQHTDSQLRSMWLSYGRSEAELRKYQVTELTDLMHLQIILRQKDVSLCLLAGAPLKGKVDREYFWAKMNDADYRKQFFTLLTGLGADYYIEVGCEQKSTQAFLNEDALWEFTKADQWMFYSFTIGKNYSSADIELSKETIATTLAKEFDKLVLVYKHMEASKEIG